MLPNIAAVYLKFQIDVAQPVFAALGNQPRIDLLMHLVRIREKDPSRIEHMEHFAKAFSICRDNRNIIVHSAVRMKAPLEEAYLYKDSRSNLGSKVRYAYSIEVTRGVLEGIKQTFNFGTALFLTATLPFAYLGILSKGVETVDPKDLLPRPLPEKPPLPTRLAPLPPEPEDGSPPQPPDDDF